MTPFHRWLAWGTVSVLLAGAVPPALAERGSSVLGTPHNLLAGGGAHDIKAAAGSPTQGRVCIFCHAPHHSSGQSPLWSRSLSGQGYAMYQSDTMTAPTETRPQRSSRLCLSCHDGTIALGLLKGDSALDPGLTSFEDMAPEPDPRLNPNLGVDLSDDHPISFEYTWKDELALPVEAAALGARLVQDVYVECTSCHDPHDNTNGNFLVVNVDARQDALCTVCHRRTDWSDDYPDTVHRSGGDRYPAEAPAVAAAGCMNCHLAHSAPGQTLLKGTTLTATCTTACHRDSPYRDIPADFQKFFSHPLGGGGHSAGESLPVAADLEHVECVDCHNPHRAGWDGAPMGTVNPVVGAVTPPAVSAVLRGVRVENGVETVASGRSAEAEYEVCFKCHAGEFAESFADGDNLMNPLPDRQFDTLHLYDVSENFAGASAHPVTSPRGGGGGSLKDQFKLSMTQIYCIDCHAPHGADYPHLLKQSNVDTFPANAVGGLDAAYPLCFACHDSGYLVNQATSRLLHTSHLFDHDVPCATCHDPHGVPAAGGSSLINFDLRYAGDDPTHLPAPIPTFDPLGRSCTVVCHTTGSPDPQTHTY